MIPEPLLWWVKLPTMKLSEMPQDLITPWRSCVPATVLSEMTNRVVLVVRIDAILHVVNVRVMQHNHVTSFVRIETVVQTAKFIVDEYAGRPVSA